jgi:hypothetical protein
LPILKTKEVGVKDAGRRQETHMDADRHSYSRYQVLCAEREAWTDGGDGEAYHYDGMSFWRRDTRGKERLLPSWRTPAHGWRHRDGCDCELCRAHRPADLRPLSVA